MKSFVRALFLTCLVIGILSAVEVYAAQLIWPASQPFPDVDTDFVHVAGRAWKPMFAIIGFTLLYGALAVIEVGLIVRTVKRGPYAHHDQPDYGEAAAIRLAPAE